MHSHFLHVFMALVSVAVLGIVLFRLHSILHLNHVARTHRQSMPGSVAFSNRRLMPAFAERWVDGVFRVRDRRLVRLLRLALPRGGTILDVGCGDGDLLLELKRAGFHVYGIEVNPLAAAAAKKLIGADRILEGDFLNVWDFQKKVDAVLFCDTLRYTTQPHRLLRRATQIAPLSIVSEPHAFWHGVGRIVYLRFLSRVDHLSILRVERFAERCVRTFWHSLWLISSEPDVVRRIESEKEREIAWFEQGLMYPALVDRLRSVFIVTGAGMAVGVTTLLLCLTFC